MIHQSQCRNNIVLYYVYTAQARHDRSRNIIISGIAEDRDDVVWRTQVDDALFIAAGREVNVNDVFRLGK